MKKLTSLSAAIDEHVRPEAHLNFASTPSRSNAAILAIAKRFGDQRPAFTLSSTGFHSLAHLLGLLRLGTRYVGCFYGDNYPTPRPNPLYQQLIDEGAVLEHWSLWSYVTALRAAAQGEPFAFTSSLLGTSLAQGLEQHGRYFETEVDVPGAGKSRCGLLRALCPDVTFVHAPVASSSGFAWFSAPQSEGFHGAFAARHGVIVTADRIVDDDVVLTRPDLIALPPHRVLAVCEAPFGAHPQPVHVATPEYASDGYDDDVEHYRMWRRLCSDADEFAQFRAAVLDAHDVLQAYRDFVGAERFQALRATSPRTDPPPVSRVRGPIHEAPRDLRELHATDRITVIAARLLVERIRARGHDCVLAGIGQAFNAARLCRALLAKQRDLELMVETGLCGFEDTDSRRLDGYLLSRRNIASSRRLSNVEQVLGTLVRGTATSCIGVVGAAQVDRAGNLNSTFVDGKLLVGSGGACDIASGAQELIVLVRSDRLVPRLDYITSVGRNVSHLVTESGVLERIKAGWVFRGLEATSECRAWPEVTTHAPLDLACDVEFPILDRLELSHRHRSP